MRCLFEHILSLVTRRFITLDKEASTMGLKDDELWIENGFTSACTNGNVECKEPL